MGLVVSNDTRAGEVLILRYQGLVRSFLRRLCRDQDSADDLAQDVFIKMLTHAHQYDAAYPMRTWLMTIARRLFINQVKRNSRQVDSEDLGWVADGREEPSETVGRLEEESMIRSRLSSAILKLSDLQRQAVILYHEQEMKVEEVAGVMDLPVGTVKSHLHRGRAALRRLLMQGPKQELQP